ncbi:MAG: Ldh family oxidoreductase [Chloroflexi bacterium]|nr:Ldh family oxidoreductase [Chloroflexota bacterium]
MGATVVFTEARLRGLCQAALEAAGLPAEHAADCADAVVFANLRGTDTHGVRRVLPELLESIARGAVVPGAAALTVRDRGPIAVLKGNGTPGPVIARQAMELAMTRAETYGVGVVSTFNCPHFGAGARYVNLALARDLFALLMANGQPNVAPHGGRTRAFGTNPIAYALPAGEERPIIFDAGTRASSGDGIERARRRGEPLPPDWAIDADGLPTTDPTRIAALLPFGGHKGYGFALLPGILTGALAGSTAGCELTHTHPDPAVRGQSFLFLALDPDFFSSRAAFKELVDRQIRAIHASPPRPGFDEVLVPGERAWREMERRRREGMPIPAEDWQRVVAALERARLPVADLLARYGPIEGADGDSVH